MGDIMAVERSPRYYASIKTYRVNSGLSVEEFAKALGVTPTTVYNWESGATIPSTERLINIAELGHLPLDFLFNYLTEHRNKT